MFDTLYTHTLDGQMSEGEGLHTYVRAFDQVVYLAHCRIASDEGIQAEGKLLLLEPQRSYGGGCGHHDYGGDEEASCRLLHARAARKVNRSCLACTHTATDGDLHSGHHLLQGRQSDKAHQVGVAQAAHVETDVCCSAIQNVLHLRISLVWGQAYICRHFRGAEAIAGVHKYNHSVDIGSLVMSIILMSS